MVQALVHVEFEAWLPQNGQRHSGLLTGKRVLHANLLDRVTVLCIQLGRTNFLQMLQMLEIVFGLGFEDTGEVRAFPVRVLSLSDEVLLVFQGRKVHISGSGFSNRLPHILV